MSDQRYACSTEDSGSGGVKKKIKLGLRCKQLYRRTPEASEVEGLKPQTGDLVNPVSYSHTVATVFCYNVPYIPLLLMG